MRNSTEEDDALAGTLLGAVVAGLASGLVWLAIVAAVRWVLQLHTPALLRLGAVALLFGGTALIFAALVRVELTMPPTPDVERWRRPTRAIPRGETPASPPTRRDATTTPPQAGGRAIRVVL
jgi:hypothetical protein